MRSSFGAVNTLLALYSGARRSGLMDAPWFQRVFLGSYFAYKRYVEDSFDALLRVHPELMVGGHVLDIGANVGYTTTVFARRVASPFHVIAFEPESKNVATLRRVVAGRGLTDRVECVHAAVGAADGIIQLWRNEQSPADHRVLTDVFKREVPADSPTVSVPMVSVDSYLATHHRGEPISFVKIDVQGYELKVLEGMVETIARCTPMTIAFEFQVESIQELGFAPSVLLEFVREQGFQLFEFPKGRVRPLAPDFPRGLPKGAYVDILASRSSLSRFDPC